MAEKKKLLIVAGAGSALDFGMPSVSEVHKFFLGSVLSQFPLFVSMSDPNNIDRSLYSYLYDEIERYWTDNIPRHIAKKPNFEDILYVLYSLAATYPDGNLSAALGAFVSVRRFPDVFRLGLQKEVDRHTLRELGQHLVDSLLDDFRERCLQVQNGMVPNFRQLESFLNALSEHFEVAIVTTNYDDLLYRCFSGIETGFDENGQFQQGRILRRSSWPCLLHLHGSVHFDMDTVGGHLHKITWQDDLTKQFHQNSWGRSAFSTIEGQVFPTSNIIAGYGKTSQLQRRPYRTYYSELDHLADSADTLLFLGYGFGDPHLNLAFSDFYNRTDRRTVVIDCAPDNAMNACGHDMDSNATVGRAMRILGVDYRKMEALGYTMPQNVGPIKMAAEFERSKDSNRKFSIWYGGMLEACRHTSKVLSELT